MELSDIDGIEDRSGRRALAFAFLVHLGARADERGRNGFPHQRLVEPGRRSVLSNEGYPIDATEVRCDPDIALLREADEFVVDFLVPDAVQEALDAGAHQELRVRQVEDVGDRGQPLLVRLVACRREHLGRELLLAAVAAVDPDLDEIGLVGCEVLHGLARLRNARDRVRHVVSGRIGGTGPRIGEAETDGANKCGVRDDFGAQFVRQLSHVGAGADGRRDAVVGVALQVIDVVLAGKVRLRQLSRDSVEEPGVAVRIDDRRHHGLAGQIDARRARRHRHLASLADRRDAAVLNDESNVFDRRAAVTDDQPRPFEHRRAGRTRRLAGSRP